MVTGHKNFESPFEAESPDHMKGRIGDFKVKFTKDGIIAEKGYENLTVRLKSWDYITVKLVEDRQVVLPLVKFVAYFDFSGISDPERFVRIEARFSLKRKEESMLGAMSEGTVTAELLGGASSVSFRDDFCKKLYGELQLLRKNLERVLESDPDIGPAFRVEMARKEQQNVKFFTRVFRLAFDAVKISEKCDVETTPKALLPIVIEAKKGEDGKVVLFGVASQLYAWAELIKSSISVDDDVSTKVSNLERADRLEKVGKVLVGLEITSLREDSEKEFKKWKNG